MKKLIAAFVFLLVSMSVISANVIPVNAEEEVEVTVTAGLKIKGMDIKEGDDYEFDSIYGILTILSDKPMTISGTVENWGRIWVTSTDGANITFENLNISFVHVSIDGTRKAYSYPPFGIDSGAGSVTITLVGNNKLEAGGGSAGLQNNSVPLTIKGDGKLEAYGWWGGAGIGGGKDEDGKNITIEGGTIIARGISGAGIGGGEDGVGYNIKITGGNVTATGWCDEYGEVANDYERPYLIGGGAGIGGGKSMSKSCSGSKIEISGGTVTATGYGGGAGIGGGDGGDGIDITISGGDVTAISTTRANAFGGEHNGGAGIGGGDGGNGENITISGTANIIKAQGAYGGAGIGGGAITNFSSNSYNDPFKCDGGGSGNNITISGTANIISAQGGGGGAAGIGGGCRGTSQNIIISENANIQEAKGGGGGAGIGGGLGYQTGYNLYTGGTATNIQISGRGTIKATGDQGGAGIGGGIYGDGIDITISGGVTVEACTTANGGGAGIGGGEFGAGISIKIDNEDGKVTAISSHGAGIGGGRGGNGDDITINNGTVIATGGSGAGIGGGVGNPFQGGKGSNITINGGEITATGGNGGAGIGGGSSGNGSGITINGGEITATGTSGGAGIGGGSNARDESTIIINDCISINAKATSGGAAGIGSGTSGTATITIAGGKEITATGGSYSAGIGGSYSGSGTVTISGGENITANGGSGGAGIGGGQYGSGTVTISGGENITANGGSDGAGIGGGKSGSATVTISGGEITATGNNGAGIGSMNMTNDSSIEITGGNVTASGTASTLDGASGISSTNVTIDGEDTSVTATGIGSGAGITGSNITINNGKVTAEGGDDGTGIGGADSTVNIKGEGSTFYPWVYTNGITSSNNDGYLAIVLDVDGTNATIYGGEVILTEEYRFNTGGTLTVKGGATFRTENWLILENNSVLYLEADATLDKYNKMTIISGEIQHEDKSDYVEDSSGKMVCDICGKEQQHNWGTAWTQSSSHHWHECTGGQDCAVVPNDIKCSITEDSKKGGYEAHIYDFDNPTDKGDGRLYYYCEVCNYEYSVDIPVIELIKVDGITGAPLEDARFGIYSDAECTALVTTRTTAIGADNKAGISFATVPDKTYYIRETKVPDGYRISDEVYKAVVGADGKVTYSVAGSTDTSEDIPVCKNYDVKVIISDPAKIIKVDGETGAPLAGAEFGIYNNEECTDLITTGTTVMDADNKAVVSFTTEPNKTYYIKETKAPDGYKISDEVFKAVVDADGKVTYSVVGSTDTSADIPVCKNYAVKVIISDPAKIIKVDGETGAPLAGARFGIYSNAECTDLITTGTTAIGADNKAVVSFATEPNKTYYIKETAAPDGYKVSDVVYKAVVDANGKVTYGAAGSASTSADIPVCKNEKSADADTSVPEDTPSDETHNPETGDKGFGFGTVGFAILSGIICAISLVGETQRRKRKNSDDDGIDF